MKQLLVAASVAAGLAAGAVGSVHAQNYFNQAAGPTSNDPQGATINDPQVPTTIRPHVGSGSRPDYLKHQQLLRNMPGYSPNGTG
jgi:hypothetical protein